LINGALAWEGHAVTLNPFLPEGMCKQYFTNGQVESQGYYIQGKKDGRYSKYFENGQLKFTGNYSDGLADGLFKSYEEDGTSKIQQLFVLDTLYFEDYFAEDFIEIAGLEHVKKIGNLYNKSLEYWDKSNYSLAIESLNSAIGLHPNYLAAYELRGFYHAMQKKYSEAITDFEYLLQTNYPFKYHANYIIANILAQQNKPNDAIQRYLHTTAICPNTEIGTNVKADCFLEIAGIYSKQKDHFKSIGYATKAIEIKPTSDNYLARAAICINSKIDSLQDNAMRDCNISIKLDNANANAYSYRALLKANYNDLQGALTDAKIALNIDPNNKISSLIYEQTYAALYPPQPSYYSSYSNRSVDFWDILSAAYTAYAIYDFVNDIGKGDYVDAFGGPIIDIAIQNAIDNQK